MNSNNKIIIMAFCSYFLVSSSMKRAITTTTTTTTTNATTRRSLTNTGIVVVEAFVPSIDNIGQHNCQQQRQYKSSAVGYASSTSLSSLSSLSRTMFSSSSSSSSLSSSLSLSLSSTATSSTTEETTTTTTTTATTKLVDNSNSNNSFDLPLLNLHTITSDELEILIISWGYPKFRSKQIYDWIRSKGITNPNDMVNIPKKLRATLIEFTSSPKSNSATQSNDNSDDDDDDDNDNDNDNDVESDTYDNFGGGSLMLEYEAISKDGTRKRAYRLRDGQLIESVLMGPYNDGRYTACISSQAGCAMGCIFCATGQMGFARQLTSNEIFEQVSRFSTELKKESIQENNPNIRLSNIVFMGMGEPLANYNNVVNSVNRINIELGIGARKITVSTVGVVPNIRKLFKDDTDMPQVRLAVSLHCANDIERSKLLPANDRYGGLHELMTTLKDYIDTTGRRITLEWALIANQNDNIETAKELGQLINTYKLRKDMVHVNVIPLNPTDGFSNGKPSNIKAVNAFCNCLYNEFSITATPRVRRGIDIDAGCGQLKAKIQIKKQIKGIIRINVEQQEQEQEQVEPSSSAPALSDFIAVDQQQQEQQRLVGVYDDDDDDDDDDEEQFFNDISVDETAAASAATTATATANSEAVPVPVPEAKAQEEKVKEVVEFTIDTNAVDFEQDDFDNPEYEIGSNDMDEVNRLMSLVVDSKQQQQHKQQQQQQQQQQPVIITADTDTDTDTTTTEDDTEIEYESILKGPTTTIVDEDAVRVAKKKRKKLLRNIKQIIKLKEMKDSGELKEYSKEQIEKIQKEDIWRTEIESLEHNLK